MTDERMRRRLGRMAVDAALLVVAAAIMVPFLWLFVTTLLPQDKAFQVPPVWWPQGANLAAYREVSELVPFTTQVFNSVKITAIIVIGSLAVSSLAAYAFARLRFPGRDAVFMVFLVALMVPTQVTLIPVFILMRYAGLLDKHVSIWLPGLIQVFAIFFLRQHFMSIPREVEEAARLDGAGPLRTLIRIFLPMSAPVLSALAIFVAQQYWNDFFGPSVFLSSPEKMTIPVGLVSLQAQIGGGPGVAVFAGITMVVLPLLVIFVFAQRWLTRGIALTGISR